MNGTAHPKTLGRYELLGELGRGRIFDVFKAKSFGVEGFEKTLVVKRVRSVLARNNHFMDAFMELVRRAVRLGHANVVQVFDLGESEEDGGVFMATEYVAGVDLDTLLTELGSLPIEEKLPLCLHVGSELAKALDHAHRRRDERLQPLRIIHGAVSARKVLVSWDGDVKLNGFGEVQALLAATPVPQDDWSDVYSALSPEQAAGQAPTTASDIFSLGVTLHAALSGEHPLKRSSGRETLDVVSRARVSQLDSLVPGVPDTLAQWIDSAMALDPAARPSAADLHEALLSGLYALGGVFGPAQLSDIVGRLRPTPEPVSGAIDVMLARPLTVEPPEFETASTDRPSLPPLAAFAEMRHVSVLALSLQQKKPLQRPQRERILSLLERHGGRSIKDTAREITAAFGLSDGDGRDAETAVRTGLLLARSLASTSARSGIAIESGRVRIIDDALATSDTATRELLIATERLAESADQRVVVGPRAARTLRRQYALERVGDGFVVGAARALGSGDRFVGRRAELQNLAEALAESSRGNLKRISIVGEPGIGKTRLLGEMQRRLSRGQLAMAIYVARCPPRGAVAPYSGVAAMLRRLCDVQEDDSRDHVEALTPRLRALGLDSQAVDIVLSWLSPGHLGQDMASEGHLGPAFSTMLSALARERFHVFAWDDAQELDEATLELLDRIGERLKDSAFSIILSGRDKQQGPLSTVFADVKVRLGELDYDEVGRLIATRVGVESVPEELTEFVWERAGGHPLFVEELLRALIAGSALKVVDRQVESLDLLGDLHLPRSVQAAVSARVHALPRAARDTFVAAAVLDAPASLEVLGAMLDLPRATLDEAVRTLVRRGLATREDPDGVGFPTPLFREIVLGQLSPEQNADLNRLAAMAYQRVLGDSLEEEAERIGYHLAAAGERDRAADFYATSGLYHLRAKHLGRSALDMAYALDLAEFDNRGGPQIGNWIRAMTNAVRFVRSGIDLSTFIDRLVERIDTHPQLEARLRVQVLVDVALVLGANDRDRDAEQLIEPLTTESERWPDIRSATLAARGELAIGQGQLAKALSSLREARGLIKGDMSERHRILVALAEAAAGSAETAEADAALRQARALENEDDLVVACERARVEAVVLAGKGEWRSAAEQFFQTAIQAQEVGLLYHVAVSLLGQSRAFVRLGEWQRADGAARSAKATAEEIGSFKLALGCDLVLGFVAALSEEHPSPDSLIETANEAGALGWYALETEGHILAGRLLARAGRTETARHQLSEAADRALARGQKTAARECQTALAELGMRS